MPYVNPIRQSQTWWVVNQDGTSLEITLDRLSRLAGPFLSVWVAVAVLATVLGITRAVRAPERDRGPDAEDLPVFGSIALVLGAAGFGVFIQMTGLLAQVWYYLPVLCFTMICCDVIVSRLPRTRSRAESPPAKPWKTSRSFHQLQGWLGTNVQEALALEVGLLKLRLG